MTGGAAGVRIERRREGGGPPIFDGVSSSPLDDRYESGAITGEGTFFCLGCGSQLAMEETDLLPECPHCGGFNFRRDSIFESRQEHGSPTSEFALPGLRRRPRWLAETRRRLRRPGYHLAMHNDEDEIDTFLIIRGWTRIGRSCTADVRLDDPSVSRRHALIVAEPGKGLRVLDDRSLNGVFVNGEAVEWAALRDGDELTIGRYSLYALKR